VVKNGTLNWQAHVAWPQINLHLMQGQVRTTNDMVKKEVDERTDRKMASEKMRKTFTV
jgi:hypothetical protein